MFAPTLDWLYWTIGGAVALVAIVFAFRAVFRDKARGRFRCPKCWYDLTAPEGAAPALPVKCSECGRETKDPRRLRKTRRRWGRVVLALVMVGVAGVVAYYPSAHRNGWLSILPTRFLIDSMPVFGYPTPLTDTLAKRLAKLQIHQIRGALPPTLKKPLEELAYVAKRISEGMPGAEPVSPEWLQTYGAFLKANMMCFFVNSPSNTSSPDPALIAAVAPLAAIEPVLTVRTRSVWPKDYPLWIDVDCDFWWFSGHSWSVQARSPETKRLFSVWNGFTVDWPLLMTTGSIDLEIWMELTADRREIHHEWKTRASVDYRVEGSLADVLTPVSDPAIDQYVKSLVGVRHGGVNLWPMSPAVPQAQGLGFGVILEYAVDTKPVGKSRMWWCGASTGALGVGHDSAYGAGSNWTRIGKVQPGENWTIRIYSDPETALRVIDADRYWQGDVTVSLTIP